MKFFYATMVFFLSAYIFIWTLVFIIPTPTVYRIGDILKDQTSMQSVDEKTLNLAIDESKRTNDDNTIIFASDTIQKRGSALFLVSIVTFVIIFFQIIVFHKRSHILFPMVAATIFAYIAYSSIWQFLNSFSKNLYLDLYMTRIQHEGILAIQFLGIYLVIFGLILVFGNWSRLSEIN